MRKGIRLLTSVVAIYFLGAHSVMAQDYDEKQKAELINALRGVPVSLEKGLSAGEREGMPISGGFEVVKGELELWVFVLKGNKLLEVTVNHRSGEIDEVEPITSEEDLSDARVQSQAMARARASLRAVAAKAVEGNPGFRAVEIVPVLQDGRVVAKVTLLRDREFKVVTEKLDFEEESGAIEKGDDFAAADSEWDPWEPFNEKTFWFNRQVDRFFLKPVATVYDAALPDPAKQGISNVLDNLDVVRRLVNNVLQLNIAGTGRELARFAINSSIGVGGLFDPADSWLNLRQSDKDTGQTLGKYGIGPGPYLVLPFLPPLTVRDFFGFVADEAMYPLDYFVPLAAVIGIDAAGRISDRAENLDKFEEVEETAVDLYGSVRNAYFQRRAVAVEEDSGE